MKTLFFCNLCPDKDGAFERVLAEVGHEHGRHGDQLVLVLAGEPMPEIAQRFQDAGIVWHIIRGWGDAGRKVKPWQFVLPGLRIMRTTKPDVAVVHFGNELPSLVLSLLALVVGLGNVRWVWQQDQQISPPNFITRWLSRIRLLSLRFHHFVVVYQGGRNAMVSRGIPGSRITVVPNGVIDPKPEVNRNEVRRQLKIGDGELVLMNVGSLIPRKRQGELIRIFARLADQIRDPVSRLILIGDGPERSVLEQQAETLGVQDRVIFLGRRNDAARLLCGADLCVHAAVAEGCAYALSEAMAAGVPLVVTDAGAAREQVDEGLNGYVVAPEAGEVFQDRIGILIMDVLLRRRMGLASRARWLAGFRIEDQARAYWSVYRRLGGPET